MYGGKVIVIFLSCSECTHSKTWGSVLTTIAHIYLLRSIFYRIDLGDFFLYLYRYKNCVRGKSAVVSNRWRSLKTYVQCWRGSICYGPTFSWYKPFKRLGVSRHSKRCPLCSSLNLCFFFLEYVLCKHSKFCTHMYYSMKWFYSWHFLWHCRLVEYSTPEVAKNAIHSLAGTELSG